MPGLARLVLVGGSRVFSTNMLLSCLLIVLAAAPSAPVVGGRPALPGEWPAVAALRHDSEVVCSGVLVAPDLVLTAGHCIDQSTEVTFGPFEDGTSERHRIDWQRAHPDWRDSYDVGLIRLRTPSTVMPVALARHCEIEAAASDARPVYILGYGTEDPSTSPASGQLTVGTTTIRDVTCEHDSACNPAVAPGGELVAGGDGVDSCYGDSGGALLHAAPDTPTVLLAVTSRGAASDHRPCGDGGIYVRADAITGWLQRTAGSVAIDTAPPCGEPPAGCRASPDAPSAAWLLWAALLLTLRRERCRSHAVARASRVASRRPGARPMRHSSRPMAGRLVSR